VPLPQASSAAFGMGSTATIALGMEPAACPAVRDRGDGALARFQRFDCGSAWAVKVQLELPAHRRAGAGRHGPGMAPSSAQLLLSFGVHVTANQPAGGGARSQRGPAMTSHAVAPNLPSHRLGWSSGSAMHVWFKSFLDGQQSFGWLAVAGLQRRTPGGMALQHSRQSLPPFVFGRGGVGDGPEVIAVTRGQGEDHETIQ